MGDPALAWGGAVARGRALERGDVGPLAEATHGHEQLVHVLGPELGGIADPGVQGDRPTSIAPRAGPKQGENPAAYSPRRAGRSRGRSRVAAPPPRGAGRPRRGASRSPGARGRSARDSRIAAARIAGAVVQRSLRRLGVPGDARVQRQREPCTEIGPEAGEAALVVAALPANGGTEHEPVQERRLFAVAAVGMRKGTWWSVIATGASNAAAETGPALIALHPSGVQRSSPRPGPERAGTQPRPAGRRRGCKCG